MLIPPTLTQNVAAATAISVPLSPNHSNRISWLSFVLCFPSEQQMVTGSWSKPSSLVLARRNTGGLPDTASLQISPCLVGCSSKLLCLTVVHSMSTPDGRDLSGKGKGAGFAQTDCNNFLREQKKLCVSSSANTAPYRL